MTDNHISKKQKKLLREVWGETVSRVKSLSDVDAVADEWLSLVKILDDYKLEAYDRYCLHAGVASNLSMIVPWKRQTSTSG